MHSQSTTALSQSKVCAKCGLLKPLTDFGPQRRVRDGLDSWCRPCKVVSTQRWRKQSPRGQSSLAEHWSARDAARVWLDCYKSTTGCVCCGECEPACLDCHHVDPQDKSSDVSKLWRDMPFGGKSLAALRREVEKCVLLCANCHRKAHAGRLPTTAAQRLAAALSARAGAGQDPGDTSSSARS